jgi:hypothetical protein
MKTKPNLHDKLNSTKAVMGILAAEIKAITDGTSSLSETELHKIATLAHQIITAKVEYADLQNY